MRLSFVACCWLVHGVVKKDRDKVAEVLAVTQGKSILGYIGLPQTAMQGIAYADINLFSLVCDCLECSSIISRLCRYT